MGLKLAHKERWIHAVFASDDGGGGLGGSAILVPGTASAQVNTFQIGTNAKLGPEGATVSVPVTVNCDPGLIAFPTVNLSQSTGHRLVQGSGGSYQSIDCTGSDQTVNVQVGNYPGVTAWKQGRASASGQLSLYDPSTFELYSASAEPAEIRIQK